MGPRHEDRGEPAGFRHARSRGAVLQWGHGTKTVENPEQSGLEERLVEFRRLQWGHGTKTVENQISA